MTKGVVSWPRRVESSTAVSRVEAVKGLIGIGALRRVAQCCCGLMSRPFECLAVDLVLRSPRGSLCRFPGKLAGDRWGRVTMGVDAIAKLAQYLVSILADPLLATWRARREVEANKILAHGEAEVMEILLKEKPGLQLGQCSNCWKALWTFERWLKRDSPED